MGLIPLLQEGWSYSGPGGRKEPPQGCQCYAVIPEEPYTDTSGLGANMLLAELVRRGDAEERGAGGVAGTNAVEAEE